MKLIPVVLSILLIAGCASEPTAITLNPTVTNDTGKVYKNLSAKISVNDLRSTAHIVELLSAEDPSTLIGTTSSLREVLVSKFSTELTSQGLNVADSSDLKVEFNVERARTYVNQDVLDYRANTIIKLKVKVENPAQTLSKTFTLRATTRGALTADIDELQRDFNIQLAKLILQVLEDQQLQEFIKG
ncbi:YajG family lipoprotein [Thalassotalea nanhaiensis]|uniref:YajG family lipoprotein n=1 Tax=Thalassotalea nanhaiensis TaxID=3065648 RepID=A0ABY9TFQ9_9GAMM|nr:YajG family lipoprotein [Colwelliaceae bacterium SQ345]